MYASIGYRNIAETLFHINDDEHDYTTKPVSESKYFLRQTWYQYFQSQISYTPN